MALCQTVFMLYLAYDTNLDGLVSGAETKRLLKDGQRYFTKVLSRVTLVHNVPHVVVCFHIEPGM
eukprot:2625144-Amphidinium_carterae.1